MFNICKYIKENETLKNFDFMTVYLTIVELVKDGKMEIQGREIGVLETEAYQIVHEEYDPDELYQSFTGEKKKMIPVRLIPYFAWDNREYGEMRIWMPWRE